MKVPHKRKNIKTIDKVDTPDWITVAIC